jgi:protein-ribulosamine 3-kinase
MMHGEFDSLCEIRKISPEFAPRPISWGTCREDRDRHFLLLDFHNLKSGPPSAVDFARDIAKLHNQSRSPNSMFGFHVTTYNGNLPQDNKWTKSWEEFFTNGIKSMLKMELDVLGPNEELQNLSASLVSSVIPRLLRPLETNGRAIKPSLLHGDLWIGNVATDLATGKPLVFDSSAYYGHHECQ